MKRTLNTVLAVAFVVFLAFVTVATLEATMRAAYMVKHYVVDRSRPEVQKIGDIPRPFVGFTVFTDHPFLSYTMKPGYKELRANYPGNEGGVWGFETNSMGFRGQEFSPRKPAGTYRIVVVGGSAVPTGSDTAHTFTSILTRLLNNRAAPDRRYEVINAGVPGYISAQELFLVETEVVYWNPDMVIVYDGFNDMGGGSVNTWRPNWHPHSLEILDRIRQSEWDPHTQIMTYRLFVDRFRRGPQSAPPGQQYKPHPEAAAVYRQNLESMVGVLKVHGIVPILVFQPTLLYRAHRTADEERAYERTPPAEIKALKFMLPLGEQALAQVGKTTGTRWADFAGVFDGYRETIFFDLMHPTDFGNIVIAARLRDLVASVPGAKPRP